MTSMEQIMAADLRLRNAATAYAEALTRFNRGAAISADIERLRKKLRDAALWFAEVVEGASR